MYFGLVVTRLPEMRQLGTMYRLVTDTKFIQSVKEEFVLGGFRNMIKGEDLNLLEVELWD